MDFISTTKLEEIAKEMVQGRLPESHFLRELLAAEIYLIHYGPSPAPGADVKGVTLSLSFTVQDEVMCVPIFSTLARLQEFTRGKSSHYHLPAREFFALLPGMDLCLNPKSGCAVVFNTNDVASLLAEVK